MEAVKAIYQEQLIQPVKGKRILITGGTTGIDWPAADPATLTNDINRIVKEGVTR